MVHGPEPRRHDYGSKNWYYEHAPRAPLEHHESSVRMTSWGGTSGTWRRPLKRPDIDDLQPPLYERLASAASAGTATLTSALRSGVRNLGIGCVQAYGSLVKALEDSAETLSWYLAEKLSALDAETVGADPELIDAKLQALKHLSTRDVATPHPPKNILPCSGRADDENHTRKTTTGNTIF